jgi:hypothetical protein
MEQGDHVVISALDRPAPIGGQKLDLVNPAGVVAAVTGG